MKNPGKSIPQAVWFALALGLPVAASACNDDSYGEKAVEQAKDVGDKVEDVMDETEDALDKSK